VRRLRDRHASPAGSAARAVGSAAALPPRTEKSLRGALASTERFRAALREAKIGPDKDIPHVTAPMIVKYITDLQLLGSTTLQSRDRCSAVLEPHASVDYLFKTDV
jgi:hypothetical protein